MREAYGSVDLTAFLLLLGQVEVAATSGLVVVPGPLELRHSVTILLTHSGQISDLDHICDSESDQQMLSAKTSEIIISDLDAPSMPFLIMRMKRSEQARI